MMSPEQMMGTGPASSVEKEYHDLLQASQDLTGAATRGDIPTAQAALTRRATIMGAIERSLAGGQESPASAVGILATILELDRQVSESWETRVASVTAELERISAGRQAGRAYRVAVGMGVPLPRFLDDRH